MPVALFEYTTRFEDDVMKRPRHLRCRGESGVYVETWEFTGEDAYEWRLLLPRPDEVEVVMSARYERRPTNDR